ncbi:major facilitator family transporter [alpha proteobacterium U9-1i]|nr:major facilitator family transporter [alpha proteobacterium U9-1i]
MTDMPSANASPQASPHRFSVLALLFLVYAFNFIDRQIIGILAAPIKAELDLSDTQLGLLGGFAFALFYTGLGVPIAWLADRTSRTWIMTIALTVWSGFTALCGMATTFTQLFLARVGVGVGEAGGVAPAYSLIADYFPPKERARALAVYSFGIPVGSAAGIAIGGALASLVDWRVAFVAVGLAGIVLAPIFRAFVREPVRGQFDAAPTTQARASIWSTARTIAVKPSFWLLSFGAASSSIMGYGIFFWMPSFLMRSYDFTLQEASAFYAALLLVGGVAGVWIGGFLADKLGQGRRSAYALIPAIAFVLALPCYAAGILSPSPVIAFALFLAPTALGLFWLGPILTAVQHLAAASMRSTVSALFLFINNLIGIGLGTLLIGALSDALTARFGEEALRYSILAGTGFYLVAALLFALAARTLPKDWRD